MRSASPLSASRFQPPLRQDLDATVNIDDSRLSVVGLRDRLLREARSERQRCLEVAEAAEKRGAELRGVVHAAVQTDPVLVLAAPSETGPFSTASSVQKQGGGQLQTWSTADDAAQAEALSIIQSLGGRSRGGMAAEKQSEGIFVQLESELRSERAQRQERETQITHERSRKEAAQQQVLCLEYELDGKEAALQAAEKALERRDADLEQAQVQLRFLQEGRGLLTGPLAPGVESAQMATLRAQMAEREQLLAIKDQHIARLLNVLRQQRQGLAEEEAAILRASGHLPC